jgi:hypothetical protein
MSVTDPIDRWADGEGDVRAVPRFIAKSIDLALFYPVFFGVYLILWVLIPGPLSERIIETSENSVVFTAVALAVWIVVFPAVEAVSISVSGTTFGKWLLGIRLRTFEGKKPGILKSLRRSYDAYARGLGLGLPLVSIAAMIFGYNELNRNDVTRWDDGADIDYQTRAIGVIRWFPAVLLFVTAKAVDLAMILMDRGLL